MPRAQTPFLWVSYISRRRWRTFWTHLIDSLCITMNPDVLWCQNLNLNNSSVVQTVSEKVSWKVTGKEDAHQKLGFKAKLRGVSDQNLVFIFWVSSTASPVPGVSCDGLVSRVMWMPHYEMTWVQWDLIRINISGILNILICFPRLDFILFYLIFQFI